MNFTVTVSIMVIVVSKVPIGIHALGVTATLALMEIVAPEKTAIHVDVIAAPVREETVIHVRDAIVTHVREETVITDQEIQILPLIAAREVTAITVQEIRLHLR